jgi:hypothetical protein
MRESRKGLTMKNPLALIFPTLFGSNQAEVPFTDYLAGTGQLPSVTPTKPPTKATALQSHKTQVAVATSAISKPDARLANTDITTLRNGATTATVMRQAVAYSPDLAATANAYIRVGIPETYTVIGRDMDGAINVEATKLAQEILRRVTNLGDPTLGYNPTTDLQSLSESLAKELLTYGGMGLELALDKSRLPVYFNPVSITKLEWIEEPGGVFPRQKVGSAEIDLDIPTFFYVSVDQDLLTPYATGMFDTAVQAVLADAQFMNDLRKSMQRVIQPRLVATIIEEKIKASIEPAVLNDPDKLRTFYAELISAISNQVTDLNPEDALISYDNVKFEMLKAESGGGGNIGDVLKAVQGLLESKLSAGAKTMPAILGRDANSSGSTTSAMLFLKNADVIRRKLNLIYSRAITQACRLMGQDVYVEFRYADLDLRPKSELEAYSAMKQSRILELLSLGFISDEEASVELTGNLPRDGHKPLAGTMFRAGASAVANPDSQTSTMKGADPGTPASPKSPSGPKPAKPGAK